MCVIVMLLDELVKLGRVRGKTQYGLPFLSGAYKSSYYLIEYLYLWQLPIHFTILSKKLVNL